MAAWDDTLTWSVRDERVDFDGTTDDYVDWSQPLPVVSELRAELSRIAELLDVLPEVA